LNASKNVGVQRTNAIGKIGKSGLSFVWNARSALIAMNPT